MDAPTRSEPAHRRSAGRPRLRSQATAIRGPARSPQGRRTAVQPRKHGPLTAGYTRYRSYSARVGVGWSQSLTRVNVLTPAGSMPPTTSTERTTPRTSPHRSVCVVFARGSVVRERRPSESLRRVSGGLALDAVGVTSGDLPRAVRAPSHLDSIAQYVPQPGRIRSPVVRVVGQLHQDAALAGRHPHGGCTIQLRRDAHQASVLICGSSVTGSRGIDCFG